MAESDREQLGDMLSAYIDGELSPDETKHVERLLKKDPEARRTLEELRGAVKVLSSLPRHPAPESVAQDLQLHVERSVLLGGSEQPHVAFGGRRSPALAMLATAAAIALVVVGWRIVTGDERPGASFEQVAVGIKKDTPPRLGELGDRGRSPEEPVERSSETERGILDLATFEQKLEAGKDATLLREHRFSNEPVRIHVTLQDRRRQGDLTTRVIAQLKQRGAAEPEPSGTDRSSRETGVHSIVFSGKRGTNFTEANQRQVFMRVTRRQLDSVMEELQHVERSGGEVVLQSPLGTHRGVGLITAVVSGLDGTTEVASAAPSGYIADEFVARLGDTEEAESLELRESLPGSTKLIENMLKTLDFNAGVTPAFADGEADDSSPAAPPETLLSRTARTRPGRGAGAVARSPTIDTKGESVDSSASRLAEAQDRETDRGQYVPTDVASRGPRDASDAHKTRRAVKGPAKTGRLKWSDRPSLQRGPSLVERGKRKLANSDRRRRPRGVGPPTTAGDGKTEGATKPAKKGGTATPRSYAEEYVTLVLQVEVAQPSRTESVKRARKLAPSNRNRSSKPDSVE